MLVKLSSTVIIIIIEINIFKKSGFSFLSIISTMIFDATYTNSYGIKRKGKKGGEHKQDKKL